jgi:hypothetical protein
LAFLKRLGSPLFDPSRLATSATLAPPKCRNAPHLPLDEYAAHHFRTNCKAMKKYWMKRHHLIGYALIGCAQQTKACSLVEREPATGTYFLRKPACSTDPKNSAHRGDIMMEFVSDNKRLMIDVTVTNPVFGGSPPGTEAASKAKTKSRDYHLNYQINPRELLIFAVETPGNISLEGRSFIKGLATRAAIASGNAGDYARTVTMFYQRVAVALQKGNAKMLSNYVSSCVGAGF